MNDTALKVVRERLGATRKVTVRLTEEIAKALDKYAESNNFNNRSWAVEEILRKELL